MHIRNTCRRYHLDAHAYEQVYRNTKHCNICQRPTPDGHKYADLDRNGELKGIVCWHCHRILYTAKNNPAVLTSMIVYMGLPTKHRVKTPVS